MQQNEGPYREDRPWGGFIEFATNEPSTVKILTVKAGEALSLQYHHKRSEEWYVISGNGTIEIGDTTYPIIPDQTHIIPIGAKHRICAGTQDVVVLEVARGSFDEKDIVRLEDLYGRTE